MNFKKSLFNGKENVSLSKHNINRRITRYFFQKKKAHKINIFFKKQLSLGYDCNYNSHMSHFNSGTTNVLKQQWLLREYLTPSLRVFKGKLDFKNYLILLNTPYLVNRQYLTLKSHLGNLTRFKKKSIGIIKKTRRQNFKQLKYPHVFWRRIKKFFQKRYRFKRKPFIFNDNYNYSKHGSKHGAKKLLTLFTNVTSMFSLVYFPGSLSYLTGLRWPRLYGNVFFDLFLSLPQQTSATNKSNPLLKISLDRKLDNIYHRRAYNQNSKISYVFTKHNSTFILSNSNIMLPYKFTFKYHFTRGYIIKKIFYSFLKPNELKKSVLNSRKKFIFNKTLNLLKINKVLFKQLLKSKRNITSYFKLNSLLDRPSYGTYFTDKLNLLSNKLVFNKTSLISRELRIPRVRFKPGYQRLWRNFRLAFAESINFRYIYQQQLTRYLTRFFRKLNQTYFSFKESNIRNITIYSRLLPDLATFYTFFKNELIFLNGKVLKNTSLHVYTNDFIQIEISNWYYIFSRWLSSFILKRNLKLKSLVFRKSLASRYKLMKQTKQRSNYTPNWIFTTQYDFADVKPFIEVDFFTLSMFMLYDYNTLLYYSPNDVRVTRYNLLRLYNWKYIN